MSFATIKSWLRDTPKSKAARLAFDRLDDRIVPAASVFDLDSSFQGTANRPTNILGMSDDSRYVIFESKATNVVVGQQDLPETNDLFWRDLFTNETRMVTALPQFRADASGKVVGYDYGDTRLSPRSFTLQAIIDGVPLLPTFKEAVISGDGKFVAFSSQLSASRLIDQFITKAQSTDIADTTIYDSSNTLDVFRWQAGSGKLDLAGITTGSPDTANGKDDAFGNHGDSFNPSISSNGDYVGFVSTTAAWYTDMDGEPTSLTEGTIVDNRFSRDVFVTRFQPNSASKVAVLSASNAVIDETQFIRTFGHASADGVVVDPNGRYLAQDIRGVVVVEVSPIDPQTSPGAGVSIIGFTIDGGYGARRTTTINASTKNLNQEAYFHRTSIDLSNDVEARLLTTLASPSKLTFAGITSQGGTAQNVIIASNNVEAIVVSTSTGGAANSNGSFTTGTLQPNVGRQDLYYIRRGFDTADINILNNAALPSTAASTVIQDPTQYDISPNGRFVVFTQFSSQNSSKATQVFYNEVLPTFATGNKVQISVDLNGKEIAGNSNTPRVSRNGRFVTFASDADANLILGDTFTDLKNASDAFLVDLYAQPRAVIPANPTQLQRFQPLTTLLSSSQNNSRVTGNGASKNAFVGSLFAIPQNGGISPSTSDDSIGRAVFNSTARDLDPEFQPAHGGTASYVVSLPVGGLPPLVPPTQEPRTAVISGGRNAGVTKLTFSGDGTVSVGQRLTPYPGFTGEIRVAIGDFDKDGIEDTAVVPGPGGGPRVIVISGANDTRIADFMVFEDANSRFRGGVHIAAGDINGDGVPELILGADRGGGARVVIYDVFNKRNLADFFAYDPNFRGGVRVATGDFNGDGFTDVLTGAGEGGGPRVSAYDGRILGTTGKLSKFIDFFAFDNSLRNGVFVGGGDLNNDVFDDIVVGAGPGGGPRVTVFESQSVVSRPQSPDKILDFFAGSTGSRAGIRVAVKNVDGDGVSDIITGEGFGRESRFRSFSGGKLDGSGNPTEIDNSFIVFDDVNSRNGAWVG